MTDNSADSQMMFYTGPLSDSSTTRDFMSVELIRGYPRLRISLGDQELMIPRSPPSLSLSDGKWHSVEILRMGKVGSFCTFCIFYF